MTALQVLGAVISAFMLWWNATLIRSARRQRRWFGAEARFLSPSRWGTRWQLGFVLPDGTEIITSTSIDGDAVPPIAGGLTNPANPTEPSTPTLPSRKNVGTAMSTR